MSHYPRWAEERICTRSQPCAAGDGTIEIGDYIIIFWETNTKALFFHGRCSDLYDDEGNFDGGEFAVLNDVTQL